MSAPGAARVTHRSTPRIRSGRWILAIACVWVTVVAPFAPAGHAQGANAGTVENGGGDVQAASGSDEIQRWWGAAGAVLCATEIRLIRVVPAIGLNPYVMAAGVGGCVLAAIDLFSTT